MDSSKINYHHRYSRTRDISCHLLPFQNLVHTLPIMQFIRLHTASSGAPDFLLLFHLCRSTPKGTPMITFVVLPFKNVSEAWWSTPKCPHEGSIGPVLMRQEQRWRLSTVQQFITHSSPSHSEHQWWEWLWKQLMISVGGRLKTWFGLLWNVVSFGGTDDVTVGKWSRLRSINQMHSYLLLITI